MNRKFISDISASTVQVILNQFLGLVIFFLTSRYLAKSVYGEMNWSLAILTFVTTILSLRLEQLVVSRIAAGQEPGKMVTLFAGHILFAGLVFYAMLLASSFIFPGFFKKHDLLLVLAISQILSFFSSPFKQLANGKENFRYLAIMSSIANVIKAIWLILAISISAFTIQQVILIYIVSSFVELCVCFYISKYRIKVSLSPRYGIFDYFILIKEALPLAGMVVLNASIARIDWILLGIFTTSEKTAEYSFAYKVFELSPIPLIILSPILLSRLSRFFGTKEESDLLQKKQELGLLVRAEMIVAVLIPLILNLVWSPLVDELTANKYGTVNRVSFLVLSFCIPFLYINNLLWSAHFAQNHLKLIFQITIITFLVVLGGDLILIPTFNTTGAAVAYFCGSVVEYFNYMWVSPLSRIRETWLSPLICISTAVASGLLACYISNEVFIRLSIALPVFCMLLMATKQIRKNDLSFLFRSIRNRGNT